MRNKFFLSITSYIFALFVFSGFFSFTQAVNSQHIQFALIILFIISTIIQLNAKFIKLLANHSISILFLFSLLCFNHLSSKFYSDNGKAIKLIALLFFFLYAAAFFYSKKEHIEILIQAFVRLSVILLLIAAACIPLYPEGRLLQGVLNPIWLSRAVSICVLYFSIQIFINPRVNLLPYVFCALGIFVIFKTGSRGPLFALLMAISTFFFISSMKSLWICIKIFIAIVLASIAAYFLTPDILVERLASFLAGSFSTSDSYRIELISSAFDLIKENPFGSGLGSYQYYTDFSYPHNIVLESLVEGGIVFTIMFIGFMFCIQILSFFDALRNIKSSETFMFLLLLMSFINAMFSGDLTSPKLLYFFMFYLFFHHTNNFKKPVRTVVSKQNTINMKLDSSPFHS